MAEITDYGELDGYTIAEIFGNEIIFNDLIKYYNREAVHVVVHRTESIEAKKQRVVVYFDDKIVIDEYYRLHHSCDMFYYLNNLEDEMEIDMCDNCNKRKKIVGQMMSEEQAQMMSNHGIVPDEHYGPKLCENCWS